MHYMRVLASSLFGTSSFFLHPPSSPPACSFSSLLRSPSVSFYRSTIHWFYFGPSFSTLVPCRQHYVLGLSSKIAHGTNTTLWVLVEDAGRALHHHSIEIAQKLLVCKLKLPGAPGHPASKVAKQNHRFHFLAPEGFACQCTRRLRGSTTFVP